MDEWMDVRGASLRASAEKTKADRPMKASTIGVSFCRRLFPLQHQ